MKKLFQCDQCKEIYESESEARQCESAPAGESAFELGAVVGPYEIRARKIGRHRGNHTWTYEGRRQSGAEGVYRYREFTEAELQLLTEEKRASK